MIRPVTIATCLLACGSGLYLYQSKHEVQLLDRTIERTVHDTNALREQSRLLVAEWNMLNETERLRQFSATYLKLKTITPSQYSSLADLDGRLPAVQAEVPPHSSDELGTEEPGTDERQMVPQAREMPLLNVPDRGVVAVATEDLPVPPIPEMPRATAVALVVRPADTRAVDRGPLARQVVADGQSRSAVVTDVRPVEPRVADQHVTEQRMAARVGDVRPEVHAVVAQPPRPIMLVGRKAPPSQPNGQAGGPASGSAAVAASPAPLALPIPLALPASTSPVSIKAVAAGALAGKPPGASAAPVIAAAAPVGRSLLGMARSSAPPAPRPTPMNATYNTN